MARHFGWDHRQDGHCGAGAPRWNVTYQDSSGSPRSSSVPLDTNLVTALNNAYPGVPLADWLLYPNVY